MGVKTVQKRREHQNNEDHKNGQYPIIMTSLQYKCERDDLPQRPTIVLIKQLSFGEFCYQGQANILFRKSSEANLQNNASKSEN